MEMQFRPLSNWPGTRTARRVSAPFRASYQKILIDLDRELSHLRASKIVLECDVTEGDCRLDGQLRASARPLTPGIVLSFESKHGPLRYMSDTYTDWQANLRAISLTLSALRAVDRYGVVKRGEQYTGWKRLAAGNGAMSREEGARFIAETAGVPIDILMASPSAVKEAWRMAAMKLHPDQGGDVHQFQRLQAAKAALEI